MKNKINSLSQTEVLILKSLELGRKLYGLEIRKVIEENFERRLNFSTLYPKLELLQAKGFITAEEDNDPPQKGTNARRKYFRITANGSQVIKQWECAYRAVATYSPTGA